MQLQKDLRGMAVDSVTTVLVGLFEKVSHNAPM